MKSLEAGPWEPEFSSDLVVLNTTEQRDTFARYLSDRIAPWYHHYIRKQDRMTTNDKGWCGFSEYSNESFVTIGNAICMILSSVIPTVSIFALYFVQSMMARLLVITGMSCLFSLIMTVIVQGKRVDVFAATTAFAAVQVVFVGGVTIIPSP